MSESKRPEPLEIWGGVECTVARIGDRFRNQCAEVPHRVEDLDLIAALGIRTLRYPILIETVSPRSFHETDWSWHDPRLSRLRELGVEVIATLCHHGSGPAYTNLLDPAFPDLIAAHAARVAERYPWIRSFTPINEPVTTARFSCLYGHWYPHMRDYSAFLLALVNECKATVLAMRAIRRARPDALLVQTEDIGKIFSTPRLSYQADHENERRWLSFDLLCGRVDRDHPLRDHLSNTPGISEADLDLFLERDAKPDVFGFNHYLTSDRFLDERVERYPDHLRGSNGRHRYADVEGVRSHLPARQQGPAARLREVWERYRLPIAVTEVHHGCTRDEQLRWFREVWRAAKEVRDEGADIRAVTAWALFGTIDWNSLLRETANIYEPGVFDYRAAPPRPTAIASFVSALAADRELEHPVLDGQGWWQRKDRFYFKPSVEREKPRHRAGARSLLVTGQSGTLGRAFGRICHHRGLEAVLASRREMDITSRTSVEEALQRHRPWAVVNTAGFVRVAEAESMPERCYLENAEGAAILAEACARQGIPFVTFSSDLVFDGELGRSYTEDNAPNPLGVYGRSKYQAEQAVLAAHPAALVVRTAAFFGPWDEHNFVVAALRRVAEGKRFEASQDIVSPTYVPDLVHSLLDLVIDGEQGLVHLASSGSIAWFAFAREAARLAGLDAELVVASPVLDRIRDTSLASSRGAILPPLSSALDRFLRDCETMQISPLAIAAE